MATRSHIAIKKADDLLTEIDADESLKKTIKDARDTLDLRLQMLRACVGNPESTIEANKATWNTFQESEPVQQGMKVSEPIATIDAHTSFSELDEYCTNFTFEGWQSMKDVKAHIAEEFKKHQNIIAQVTSQTGRIAGLMSRKVQQAEREAEKATNQVLNAAAKAAAKAKTKSKVTDHAAAKKTSTKRMCQIFESLVNLNLQGSSQTLRAARHGSGGPSGF